MVSKRQCRAGYGAGGPADHTPARRHLCEHRGFNPLDDRAETTAETQLECVHHSASNAKDTLDVIDEPHDTSVIRMVLLEIY